MDSLVGARRDNKSRSPPVKSTDGAVGTSLDLARPSPGGESGKGRNVPALLSPRTAPSAAPSAALPSDGMQDSPPPPASAPMLDTVGEDDAFRSPREATSDQDQIQKLFARQDLQEEKQAQRAKSQAEQNQKYHDTQTAQIAQNNQQTAQRQQELHEAQSEALQAKIEAKATIQDVEIEAMRKEQKAQGIKLEQAVQEAQAARAAEAAFAENAGHNAAHEESWKKETQSTLQTHYKLHQATSARQTVAENKISELENRLENSIRNTELQVNVLQQSRDDAIKEMDRIKKEIEMASLPNFAKDGDRPFKKSPDEFDASLVRFSAPSGQYLNREKLEQLVNEIAHKAKIKQLIKHRSADSLFFAKSPSLKWFLHMTRVPTNH